MVICQVLATLISFTSGLVMVDYRFYLVDTQVSYDYSGNNYHGVIGLSLKAESWDPDLSTMGARFSSAKETRVTLPPNAFTTLQVDPGKQFSVLFWIYPRDISDIYPLFDREGDPSPIRLSLDRREIQATIKGNTKRTSNFNAQSDKWQMISLAVDCLSSCTITPYLNAAQAGSVIEHQVTLADDPSRPFTLGYSEEKRDSLRGYIQQFILFEGLLQLSQLGDYFGSCTCGSICGYIATDSPPYRCFPNTEEPLPSCPASNNCRLIDACAFLEGPVCFSVGGGCSSSCYTCVNGVPPDSCSTCVLATDTAVSPKTAELPNTTASTGTTGSSYTTESPDTAASGEITELPDTCICSQAYYLSGLRCLPCNPACESCEGPDISMCLSCYTNAFKQGNYCLCNTSYFPNSHAGNCSPCHSSCLSCNGSSSAQCETCYSNALLQSGVCQCDIGFYPNYSVSDCAPCDTICKSCASGSATQCKSCHFNAHLDQTLIGTCLCDDGYAPNPNASSCSSCAFTCATCSNTASDGCFTCKANAFLVASSPSPCECNLGFFGSPANCQVCDWTCLQCGGAGALQCTSCKANASLVGSSPSSCQCDVGFFGSPDSANCIACDSTCGQCEGAGPSKCTSCHSQASLEATPGPSTCQCETGFFGSPDSTNCQVCDSACMQCGGAGSSQCTSCRANASLVETPGPSACQCDAGFFESPANCFPCDPTCATCTKSDTACSLCKANAQLSGPIPSPCTCRTGYFPSPDASNCLSCGPACLVCTALSCTDCNIHATLQSGACMCDFGYFYSSDTDQCSLCDPACETCLDAGPSLCLTCCLKAHLRSAAPSYCDCDAGFFPDNTAQNCSPCNGMCWTCSSAAVCLSCYSNASVSGGNCTCNAGYFPDSDVTTCSPCHPTCASCALSSDTSCTLCKLNAHLVAGTSPGQCTCDSGATPSPDASNCLTCHSSCESCSVPGSITGCKSCYSHAVVLSLPGVCNCESGYSPVPDSANCVLCANSCLSCNGPGTDQCLTCFENAALFSSAPSNCVCNSHFFGSPPSCQACAVSCARCQNASAASCTECWPRATLSEPSPNICTCEIGHYLGTTSCLECDISCVSCSGPDPNQCLDCYSHAELASIASSSCVCFAGFFPNPTSRNCQNCDSSCATCLAGTSKDCASCGVNMTLSAAAPAQCECVVGAYAAGSGCVLCPGLCAACTTDTDCLSCKVHSSFSNSHCTCDSGFLLSSDSAKCDPCDSTCLSCASTLPSGCLSCKVNSTLTAASPSTCTCNPGFQLSSGNCLPISCDSSCARCSLLGVCEECYSQAGFLQEDTVCNCAKGYYPKPDASNCQPCHTQCLTCVNGSQSGCSQCKANAALLAASPAQCECVAGFFPSPDTGNCAVCLTNCSKCSDSSTCVQCASHYYATSSGCQICPSACLSCQNASICLSCQPGLFLTTIGECRSCSRCNEPLIAYISGPVDSDYNITFDRPVERVLNESDLAVTSVPQINFTWALPSGSEGIVRVKADDWTNVTALIFRFVGNVTDIYGFPLTTLFLTAPPPSSLPASPSLNHTITTATQASAAFVAVSALILGPTVGGGSIAMALLSQMQYFSYIGTANYSMTGTMNNFYTNLNQKSTLPNVFHREKTGTMGRKLGSIEELIVVKDFLDSAGQYLTLFAGIVSLHLLLFLLNKVLKSRCLVSFQRSFEWTIYLYFWYFAFLDLQISALLHLKDCDLRNTSLRAISCLTLALMVLVLTAFTPFLAYFYIYRHKEALLSLESAEKQRFGAFVADLRTDVRWAKYLVPMYYLQRLSYGLLIVFLRGKSLSQSLVLVLPCGLMTVFVLGARPMLMQSSRVLHIVAELDALAVYVLLCLATLQYTTPRVDISWVIVAFTLKSFTCTFLIVVIHAISGVKAACLNRRMARERVYVETVETGADFRTAMWADQADISFGGPKEYLRKVKPLEKAETLGSSTSTKRSEQNI